MSELITYDLPPFHAGQAEVARSDARFRVVSCGRRWGKTLMCGTIATQAAAEGKRIWWCAPSYRQADEGWRVMESLARQLPGVAVRQDVQSIRFPGGGSIEIRTGDDPDRLRGSGLDLLVLDEAAYFNDLEAAWTVLRPALADRKGRAILASTPRGRDAFFRCWNMGQSQEHPDWMSWKFPTETNPHIAPDEVEANRRTLPQAAFRQEWLGEFLDGEGLIFRNVREQSTGRVQQYAGGSCVVFCDPAGVGADWCALSVMRTETGHVRQVFADRWSGQSFELTIERIAAAATRYRAGVVVDVTGTPHEDAWLGEMRKRGIYARGIRFNRANKPQWIAALEGALERGDVTLLAPDSCPAAAVQLEEMLSFTCTRSPATGNLNYHAPAGMHDDTVTAAIGSYWHAREAQGADDVAWIWHRMGGLPG